MMRGKRGDCAASRSGEGQHRVGDRIPVAGFECGLESHSEGGVDVRGLERAAGCGQGRRGVSREVAGEVVVAGGTGAGLTPLPRPSAQERRDGFLVEQADAAVVVWHDRDPAVRRVLALVEKKGVLEYVIGAPVKPKVKRVRDPEEPSRPKPTSNSWRRPTRT
jgi:hypothetical protein